MNNILQAYISQLPAGKAEEFLKKYQSMSEEDKEVVLHQLSTMIPEVRNSQPTQEGLSFFQDGGLQDEFDKMDPEVAYLGSEGDAYIASIKAETPVERVAKAKEIISDNEGLQKIQSHLRDRYGIKAARTFKRNGQADGIMGSGTQLAIKKFAEREGISPEKAIRRLGKEVDMGTNSYTNRILDSFNQDYSTPSRPMSANKIGRKTELEFQKEFESRNTPTRLRDLTPYGDLNRNLTIAQMFSPDSENFKKEFNAFDLNGSNSNKFNKLEFVLNNIPFGTTGRTLSNSLGDAITAVSLFPVGRAVTFLPNVGKAVQVGKGRFATSTGQIVDKMGKVLEKASPKVKEFFKRGASEADQYSKYTYDRLLNPTAGRYRKNFNDTRGTLQRFLQDNTVSSTLRKGLTDLIQSGKRLSQTAYSRLKGKEKSVYDDMFKETEREMRRQRSIDAESIFNNVMQKYGGKIK